jgi:ribA/ribD-fused uncharacterized protein
MMHGKALLFAPTSPITAQIMSKPAPSPKKIKSLGQQVPNFDQATWEKERYGIVLEGTYLKFSQNKELKEQLLATVKKELVEASPRDRIWGVGFGANNAGKMRERWGLNLLGKALMEVRGRLGGEVEEEREDGLAEGEMEVLGERGEGGKKRKIEGLIKGAVGKKGTKGKKGKKN